MHFHGAINHIEGYVGLVQEIIGEILFDQKTLIAAANDEFVDPVGRVNFHDVPQDRPTTDFYHRLGLEHGFFAEAGTEAAGQDNGFHARRSSMVGYDDTVSGTVGRIEPSPFYNMI